ncbi:putative inactive peptidyl-prolyl cis-trans isomerase-like 6 [Tubulanus polymorphus]|uniref:putative inactive peptidyl-prolyl cis-trans isomerase-like 6 n=1 Tax=Tubulanus polymorphus TaxID=672921 RepID=UPI003DA1F5EF
MADTRQIAAAGDKPIKLELFGLVGHVQFQIAKCCVEDLTELYPEMFPDNIIQPMLEFDWGMFVEDKKRELGGETWAFEGKSMAFLNGEFIGAYQNLTRWAQENFDHKDFRPPSLYKPLAKELKVDFLNSKKHDFVYVDISIGDEPADPLIIELFSDRVPKTCKNFKALITGEKGTSVHNELEVYNLHYKDTIFHRIVRKGWIQGGDIWEGRGNGGESIYGPVFDDENFSVEHNKRGILGMVNKGRHTNGSQFYITLQATPWMNHKYVAFGQVIEGTETLKKMEDQETIIERPTKEIKIVDCGIKTYTF